MRVVHITNNNIDGVGRAVMRVHEKLLSIGSNSHVLVLHKEINTATNSLLDNEISDDTAGLIFYNLKGVRLAFLIKKALSRILRTVFVRNRKYLFNHISPWVSCNNVSALIRRDDVVVLYSIQEMIEPNCIAAISEVSNFPIIIRPLDMEPFTGGCHFNYGCMKYKKFCGKCEQLTIPWSYDISYRSLQLKKELYSGLNCKVITSNKYVKKIASKSTVFKHKNIDVIYMGIEEARYREVDQKYAREQLNIPLTDKVIIFGCFNFDDPRKGVQILKESLIKIMANLDDEYSQVKNSLHIVTFGEYKKITFSDLSIKWTHLGVVESSEKMNNIYRAGNLLASPSIDDLGPTIVQEAFLNDLPVVAFDLGVAQDLVINSENGYLVQQFNVDEFSNALMDVLLDKLDISISASEKILELKQKCTAKYEAEEYIRMIDGFSL